MRIFIDEPVKWMLSNKVSVVINAPVEQVFSEITTFRFLGSSAEKTSPGPVDVGTTFKVQIPGAASTVTARVTEIVPNRRLAYVGSFIGTDYRVALDVDSVSGGTKVRYSHERLRLGPVFAVLGPLILWVLPAAWIGNQLDARLLVRRIRKRVESELLEAHREQQ